MKRTVIAIMLAVMVLAGCGRDSTAYKVNTVTVKADTEKDEMELKACFGTITEISDGKVYIKGVNDVLYVGGTELLGDLKVDDFVYFEYSACEQKDDVYEVEFTILDYENSDEMDEIISGLMEG